MENKHDVHYCENCPDKDTCPDRQSLIQNGGIDPAHLEALNALLNSPEFRESFAQDFDILGELYLSAKRAFPPLSEIAPLIAHLSRSSYAVGYYRAQQNQPIILPLAQEYPERER